VSITKRTDPHWYDDPEDDDCPMDDMDCNDCPIAGKCNACELEEE
jgi:hypothetical protein